MAPEPAAPSADDSLPDLVRRAVDDVSRLVRAELRLAQVELAGKARDAGIGLGLFAGAAALGLAGLGALVTAAILGLATALSPWLSAVVVGLALVLLAVVGAGAGLTWLRRAAPPIPEEALDSVRQDIERVTSEVTR